MEDDGDAAATSSVSNAGVNNVDGNVKDDGNDNSVDSDKSHPHIMENSRKKRSSMHNQASRAATLPEQSHNHRPSEILLSEDKNRKIPDIELSGFGDDDDSAESSQTRPGAEFVPGILWRSITINNSNALRVSSASFEAHAADAAGALEAELAPDLNALVTEELRRRNLSQHLQEQVLLVNAEVVAPPILTKANLQFPKFSRAAEKRFQAEHALLIKGIVPLAVPFGNATVMIYCFWDMVQPDANLATTVGLRIAMVSLITGIAIASRFRFFLTWAQPIIVLSLTAATTLQITLSYILKDGFIVAISGIGVYIMATCTLGMLQFRYALAYNVAILVITNLMIVYDEDYLDIPDVGGGARTSTNSTCGPTTNSTGGIRGCVRNNSAYGLTYVLINSNFYLSTFASIGVVFSYLVELYLRHKFRDTGTIFQWTKTAAPRRSEISDVELGIDAATPRRSEISDDDNGVGTSMFPQNDNFQSMEQSTLSQLNMQPKNCPTAYQQFAHQHAQLLARQLQADRERQQEAAGFYRQLREAMHQPLTHQQAQQLQAARERQREAESFYRLELGRLHGAKKIIRQRLVAQMIQQQGGARQEMEQGRREQHAVNPLEALVATDPRLPNPQPTPTALPTCARLPESETITEPLSGADRKMPANDAK